MSLRPPNHRIQGTPTPYEPLRLAYCWKLRCTPRGSRGGAPDSCRYDAVPKLLPGFYARPETIDDIVDHSVGRVLDLFGLDSGKVTRWGETGRGRLRGIAGGRPPKAD